MRLMLSFEQQQIGTTTIYTILSKIENVVDFTQSQAEGQGNENSHAVKQSTSKEEQ
jgi:hypothetical protein